MRLDRLLGIVTVLLQQDQVTAPYLAEKFEVSRRTILRDIDAICMAGIPVVTTRGGRGGISILKGYKLNMQRTRILKQVCYQSPCTSIGLCITDAMKRPITMVLHHLIIYPDAPIARQIHHKIVYHIVSRHIIARLDIHLGAIAKLCLHPLARHIGIGLKPLCVADAIEGSATTRIAIYDSIYDTV